MKSLIKSTSQPTTLATLQQCTATDRKAFNMQLVKIEQGLSVQESIETGLVLTNVVRDKESKISAIEQICKIIEYFQELTNVNKKMEAFQIQVLAGDLLDAFTGDTIEDIILMFKMARKGEFGQVYRIDGMVIMSWVPQYLEYKAEERERLYRKQESQRKKEEQNSDVSDKAIEKLDLLISKLSSPVKDLEAKPHQYNLTRDSSISFVTYLENLPESCKKLSKKDLAQQITATAFSCPEAHEILIAEKERRNEKKK
ncbi:hypothetical protein [Elizabethkingia anophelis]|uniref:hypothetical protein n=2 Tax=Elizabethkingia anophelis TaxID=1117645 RepID=UPI0024E1A736|nr:hypothetical protein [Elizabethkingia anophelis]